MFSLVPRSKSVVQVPRTLLDIESLFENFFDVPVYQELSNNLEVDIRELEKEYLRSI